MAKFNNLEKKIIKNLHKRGYKKEDLIRGANAVKQMQTNGFSREDILEVIPHFEPDAYEEQQDYLEEMKPLNEEFYRELLLTGMKRKAVRLDRKTERVRIELDKLVDVIDKYDTLFEEKSLDRLDSFRIERKEIKPFKEMNWKERFTEYMPRLAMAGIAGLVLASAVNVGLAQDTYNLSGNTYDAFAQTDLDSVFLKIFNADSSMQDSGYSIDHQYFLSITPVGIDPGTGILPEEFRMLAYPNPANPRTNIAFDIPEAGNYVVESFDLLGRQLAKFSKYFEPGSYQTPYGGAETASGIQFIRVRGKDYSKTIKVTFMDGGDGTGFGNISGGGVGQISKSLGKAAENLEFRLIAEKEGYEPYDTLLTLSSGDNFHDVGMNPIDNSVYFNGLVETIQMNEDSSTTLYLDQIGFEDPDNDDWNVEVLGLGENASFQYNSQDRSLQIIGSENYNGTIEDIVIRVSDDDGGYAESNAFDINIQAVNDIPRIITSIPNQTVEEGSSLIIPMNGFYVEDVDDDHIYFQIYNIYNVEGTYDDEHQLTGVDSLVITPNEGFEGLISGFQVYALDEHAMSDQDMVLLNSFDINVTPRVPTNLHVKFKSVYGDTILTSGTSTFKYRKMETGTPGWNADSVRVTENGILDIQVPRNTPLNLKALYSNAAEHYIEGDIYAFFQKNGQTIEETALDDSSAIVTFNALNDTLTVYKLMNDFPIGSMSNIASRTGGINVGIRKFASYPINAYWLTGDGHETPDSLRLARHAEIEADIRTVPHMQNFAFNTQLVPNLTGIGYPRFWLGIRSDYPSPGTNATSYDSSNNITNAQARYPWQPDQYTQKIEEHQALFDLEDPDGFDPDILDNVGGLVKLNTLGRKIYSAIGIARPGTKF